MTEREKMINEMTYDAGDSELVSLRRKARKIYDKINRCEDGDEKTKLTKQLFGKTGKNIMLSPDFKCNYGSNIYVGENFYTNFNVVILDGADVIFGDDCFVAANVGVYSASHPTNGAERKGGNEFAKKIIIGNNCWIGGSAVICPGVTLGNNVVVGAGSVVTKSFGDNVVIAGNPARIIKDIK